MSILWGVLCIQIQSHYMAFAETPNRIRKAVLSVRFKIGFKCQVEKNQEFPIFCPTTPFCLNFNTSGIEPGSMAELPTTLNTQVKECYIFMSVKQLCSAKWWTFISQRSKFHFPIFLLSKRKVLIYSVSVYHCLPLCKVWWTKANNKKRPQSQTCFWARRRNKIPHGICEFFLDQLFHKC